MTGEPPAGAPSEESALALVNQTIALGARTAEIRLGMLAIGVLGALVALYLADRHIRPADELALGASTPGLAYYQGRPISTWKLPEYEAAYPKQASRAGEHEGLWLGNSQLFAMANASEGAPPAPQVASQQLGYPVMSLALPNANPKEQLVVTAWALSRRQPDRLILPVMFSDLREDTIRPGLEALATPDVIEVLDRSDTGKAIAGSLAELKKETGEGRPKSRFELVEGALNQKLAEHWKLWRDRADLLAESTEQGRQTMKTAMGIKRNSTRHIIPALNEGHMAAISELLGLCREKNVKVLVYVTPVRLQPAPPYDMNEYHGWKAKLQKLAADQGADFADFEELVPSTEFTQQNGIPDFKHFTGTGHAALGQAVAQRLRLGTTAEAPTGGTQ